MRAKKTIKTEKEGEVSKCQDSVQAYQLVCLIDRLYNPTSAVLINIKVDDISIRNKSNIGISETS